MNKLAVKKNRENRRKLRIKKKIRANRDRLRLCISRSNKNFYVQIIDDVKGVTLIGVSTLEKDFSSLKNRGNIEAAKFLGKVVAEKAKQKNITEVVFDRNGLLYHGKVKAFADSLRENGMVL